MIILVSYDLKSPGKNYQPVWDYLRKFTHCKQLESLWLLDTQRTSTSIRDELRMLVDQNDAVFVARLTKDWASSNCPCGDWLNSPARSW